MRQSWNHRLVCFIGFRLSPLISPVDEEVESQHLKFLAQPQGKFETVPSEKLMCTLKTEKNIQNYLFLTAV